MLRILFALNVCGKKNEIKNAKKKRRNVEN